MNREELGMLDERCPECGGELARFSEAVACTNLQTSNGRPCSYAAAIAAYKKAEATGGDIEAEPGADGFLPVWLPLLVVVVVFVVLFTLFRLGDK